MADKKRILIADDDEAVLASLMDLLVFSGFEVQATQKAEEIIPMAKSFSPDLIILDLLMPNLGGLEVCGMLNKDKQTRGIPIIVVSGLGSHVDIEKIYRLGVINYFTKPYDFKELLQEINKAIA
jgi:two-component system alkaline phosphatase synthesis response regulator PhoP